MRKLGVFLLAVGASVAIGLLLVTAMGAFSSPDANLSPAITEEEAISVYVGESTVNDVYQQRVIAGQEAPASGDDSLWAVPAALALAVIAAAIVVIGILQFEARQPTGYEVEDDAPPWMKPRPNAYAQADAVQALRQADAVKMASEVTNNPGYN